MKKDYLKKGLLFSGLLILQLCSASAYALEECDCDYLETILETRGEGADRMCRNSTCTVDQSSLEGDQKTCQDHAVSYPEENTREIRVKMFNWDWNVGVWYACPDSPLPDLDAPEKDISGERARR